MLSKIFDHIFRKVKITTLDFCIRKDFLRRFYNSHLKIDSDLSGIPVWTLFLDCSENSFVRGSRFVCCEHEN